MRNTNLFLLVVVAVLFSGTAFGQSINGGTANGNAGTNVNLPIDFAAGGGVAGFTVDIDTSGFDTASCAVTQLGSALDTCTDIGGSVYRLNVADLVAPIDPLPNGTAANLTLGIPAAASGSINVPVSIAAPCSDTTGGTVACSANNGTVNVTVAAPEYSSNPLNGGTIPMAAQQGNTDGGILVVNNTGDANLVISNIGITGDIEGIFSVDPADVSFTVNPAGSRNVDFTCAPTLATPPATYNALVTVDTNDTSEPTVNYTLECQVTAAAATVSVTMATPVGDPDCTLTACSFPDTPAGEVSDPKTMTLTNNDLTDAATGFNIQTVTANFNQSNDCGASLAAQQTCNIDVRFTPAVPGQQKQSGIVSVSGGNLANGQSITLSGTGLPAVGDDDDDDDDDDGGLLALGNYVSGSYFGGASQDGHGFLIEVQDGVQAGKGLSFFIVYWFVYLDGEQAWLVGATTFSPGATSVTVPMQITSGAGFPNPPESFDPESVVKEDWGTTTFEFQDDCISGLAGWDAQGDFAADYGSGELPIVRITTIVDCP